MCHRDREFSDASSQVDLIRIHKWRAVFCLNTGADIRMFCGIRHCLLCFCRLLLADGAWRAHHDHVQARGYSPPSDGSEWGELY